MKHRFLQITFLLSALLFGIAIFIDSDVLRAATKALPVLILLFLSPHKLPYSRFIKIGLFFSLVGDVFLMHVIDWFIAGLASFLVAHVFYILAFLKKSKQKNYQAAAVIFAVFGAYFAFLYPRLGEMLPPVTVYMLVIAGMIWRAFAQQKSGKLAHLAFYGAVLFGISDALIAFNKFYLPFEAADYLIIYLYWLAQYLIWKSAQKTT